MIRVTSRQWVRGRVRTGLACRGGIHRADGLRIGCCQLAGSGPLRWLERWYSIEYINEELILRLVTLSEDGLDQEIHVAYDVDDWKPVEPNLEPLQAQTSIRGKLTGLLMLGPKGTSSALVLQRALEQEAPVILSDAWIEFRDDVLRSLDEERIALMELAETAAVDRSSRH